MASIRVATSNAYFFNNSSNNDICFFTNSNASQQILFGSTSNVIAPLTISNSNISVAGNVNFGGILMQNGTPYVGSQWSNNSSNVFLLSSNVGIGKSNPQYALDILGSVALSSNLILAGSLALNGIDITGNTGGMTNIVNNAVSSQWTSTGSNVFILSSNIGIGKSNPAFALDVIGDLNFSGTLRQGSVPYVGSQWSNNSSNVFILSSNVGIGKSNPQATLDITGTVNISSNVMIGGILTVCNVEYVTSNITIYNSEIINSNLTLLSSYNTAQSLNITSSNVAMFMCGNLSASSYNNIVKNGDVGIFFSSNLSVNTSAGLVIGPWTNNGTYGIRIAGNGNTGINNSNPQYPLDVTGTIKCTSLITPSIDMSSYTAFNGAAFQKEYFNGATVSNGTYSYTPLPTKGGTCFLFFINGSGWTCAFGVLNMGTYGNALLLQTGSYSGSVTYNGYGFGYTPSGLPGGGVGWAYNVTFIPIG